MYLRLKYNSKDPQYCDLPAENCLPIVPTVARVSVINVNICFHKTKHVSQEVYMFTDKFNAHISDMHASHTLYAVSTLLTSFESLLENDNLG